MSNKTLLEQLDALHADIHTKLEKASFLGKSMAGKLAPIEDILLFVGRIVQKLEALDAENVALKEELDRINLELAHQSYRMQRVEDEGN